jgi:hypothetical protein
MLCLHKMEQNFEIMFDKCNIIVNYTTENYARKLITSSCRRRETMSLNCGHRGAYYLTHVRYTSKEIHSGMILRGENF